MQFKHPEILYFLFLLVIPILVHLFQLRKFKKEYFTNVKLLRELQLQTRKSSTIKKWLLLATRLLLLTALIFAFAQPFKKAKDKASQNNELVLFVDNSFSMQAKGSEGELFKKSIQDILEHVPENQQVSIVTPSESYWDVNPKTILKELQNLSYTFYTFQPDYLLAQAENKKPNTAKDYIFITDAQNVTSEKIPILAKENKLYGIFPEAENKGNCSIDQVEISSISDSFYEITVSLSKFGTIENNLLFSIISDADETVAKSTLSFEDGKNRQEIKINLPKKAFSGKAIIEDNSLPYDNTFYFTLVQPEKLNVLVLGLPEKNSFISKIITKDEFNITETTLEQLDFSSVEQQNTIILNELENITPSLNNTLGVFYEKGGNLIIVPNEKSTTQNLNSLLSKLGNNKVSEIQKGEKLITEIHFQHPLFKDVFEKKISNFQYPNVKSYFPFNGNVSQVLSFEDQTPFLSWVTNKKGNAFIFSASINKSNSNFQNSPLIVPAFYNMAKFNTGTLPSSYTIGNNETLFLDASIGKDQVVAVQNEKTSFIPLQQILNSKVKITFGDYPQQAGNYNIVHNQDTLARLSFNYPRTESDLNNRNENFTTHFTKIQSVDTALNEFHLERNDTGLWKWFIIATLLLLLTELLIQKFVK
ncbi:BatA domain-containing protein [Flavobacterium sp. U410]